MQVVFRENNSLFYVYRAVGKYMEYGFNQNILI